MDHNTVHDYRTHYRAIPSRKWLTSSNIPRSAMRSHSLRSSSLNTTSIGKNFTAICCSSTVIPSIRSFRISSSWSIMFVCHSLSLTSSNNHINLA